MKVKTWLVWAVALAALALFAHGCTQAKVKAPQGTVIRGVVVSFVAPKDGALGAMQLQDNRVVQFSRCDLTVIPMGKEVDISIQEGEVTGIQEVSAPPAPVAAPATAPGGEAGK